MSSLVLGITFFASLVVIPTVRASNVEGLTGDPGPRVGDLPGKDLETLLALSQPGVEAADGVEEQLPGDLRLRAWDLLASSTNLSDRAVAAGANGEKYRKTGMMKDLPAPASGAEALYQEKLEDEAKDWVSKSDSVYLHVKKLRDESSQALKLVLQAADMFSALAKGLQVSWKKLETKDAKMSLMSLFKDKDRWEKFLTGLRTKNLITERTKEQWLQDPFNATDTEEANQRQQYVQRFLAEQIQINGGEFPMDLMNKFDLPAWYEVELDWLKQYAKLFNAEGRNGPSPHMARNDDRNVRSLQQRENSRRGDDRPLDALGTEAVRLQREGALGHNSQRRARQRERPDNRRGYTNRGRSAPP